jgi:hypothetical protein
MVFSTKKTIKTYKCNRLLVNYEFMSEVLSVSHEFSYMGGQVPGSFID